MKITVSEPTPHVPCLGICNIYIVVCIKNVALRFWSVHCSEDYEEWSRMTERFSNTIDELLKTLKLTIQTVKLLLVSSSQCFLLFWLFMDTLKMSIRRWIWNSWLLSKSWLGTSPHQSRLQSCHLGWICCRRIGKAPPVMALLQQKILRWIKFSTFTPKMFLMVLHFTQHKMRSIL